jgi:hypothetical protein
MKHALFTLLVATLCATTSFGQTIKTLGFNTTNGQVVANTGTNVLTFTNDFVKINTISAYVGDLGVTADNVLFDATIEFTGTNVNQHIANTRANLGFSTNLNTFWTATNFSNARSAVGLGWSALTNTNAANFRTAIALGQTDSVTFSSATISNSLTVATTLGSSLFINNTNISIKYGPEGSGFLRLFNGGETISLGADGKTELSGPLAFDQTADAAITRTNLGLPLPALTNTSNVTTMRALSGSTNTNHPYSGVLTVLDVGAFDDTVAVTISNGIIISIVP